MILIYIMGLLLIGLIIFLGIKNDNLPLFIPVEERLDTKSVKQFVEYTQIKNK